jgi:hypothetical protein
MTLEPNAFAIEISNVLAATGTDYMTTVVNLDTYGTSCEITKHGSDRKLHLTPVDDSLIDMVLYDETGTTIASGTLFAETASAITPKELATIATICL